MTDSNSNSNNNNPTLTQPFHTSHFESLPHAPCVSLYHRNGRVGCGTYGREVMTGRILHWDSVVVAAADDGGGDNNNNNNGDGDDGQNNRNLETESAKTIPPYVAVMEEQNYTADNIAKLMYYASQYAPGNHYGEVEQGGPLRGVLVLASSSSSNSDNSGGDGGIQFPSPEPLTPQGDETPSASLTIGSSYEWNAQNNGDGLTVADMYGLPTAYIYDVTTSEYLMSVASEQSKALSSAASSTTGNSNEMQANVYPSILSEFNYYMGPGGDVDSNGNQIYNSKKCLEWKDLDGEWDPRCAPLGGNSVWAVAGSPLPLGYNGDAADADENNNDGQNEDGNGNNANANGNSRPTILIATSIDSTSMFHDLVPAANTAASNILALLMAANLIGSNIKDEVLDGLYGRVVFGFFQGESFGFLGSRRFLKDVGVASANDANEGENGENDGEGEGGGFQCTKGNQGVPSVYKLRDQPTTPRACLHPLRTDLTFQNLGEVRGMIAVDQVGNLGGSKQMYVQGGEGTDGGNGFGQFLSEVMVELSPGNDNDNDNNNGGYTVQASSVQNQDDRTYPLPPTPLSSLVQLSSSSIGGVVLTGYDDAFVANSLYHSHRDSVPSSSEGNQSIDKDDIAAAATVLARTAVAAAYQSANNDIDAETAAAYALQLLPTPIDSTSSTFTSLYTCLFQDGNCDTLLQYGNIERANDAKRTGQDLGMGMPLGSPPNYYVSIYDINNGQAFVDVGGKRYGSHVGGEVGVDGETVKEYGEEESDAFHVRPTLLEMGIFGLLNDFLGRGSFIANEDGSEPELVTCKSNEDCASVSYCDSGSSNLVVPTCAGGSCVCGSRSHYHTALDEALEAATNVGTGRFEIQEDNDEGISALYTEPYWSKYVGVRIYNDAGNTPGVYAASIGAVFALVCVGVVWRLKKTMVKQKVY